MKHFLSESATWQTTSDFVTPNGIISYGKGESVITIHPDNITNNSWAQLGEIKRENNYLIHRVSTNRYLFESVNPELGIQTGIFDVDRNTVFSKFKIEGTTINGYEIIRREDDICYAQGALYDNDLLINTWTAKMNMVKTISLRPLEENDISMVEKWIHQDYILRWYHEPDDWIMEMHERNGEFSFLHHFIVYENDNPIGFCQYYDCFDAQEEWYNITERGNTYSVDYLIGDPEYLQRGYGKSIVKLLTDKIKAIPGARMMVVQPEKENIASVKALLSNGYIYDKEKEYWYLGW